MNKERLEAFNIENILCAADSLFREFGYENTTMDKIAKLANYSKTTVYVYFTSKEDIFFALMLKRVEELRDDLSLALDKGLSFNDTLSAFYYLLVDMEASCPHYFDAMIGNINMRLDDSDTPDIYRGIFNVSEQINGIIFKLIDRGVAEKIVDPDLDKTRTALYLWGSITGVVRMAKQKGDYYLLKNITPNSMLEFCLSRIQESIK